MSPDGEKGGIYLFEDWNERDGKIYYRWRLEGETEWHEKLTPYTEKPYYEFKLLSQEEVNDMVATDPPSQEQPVKSAQVPKTTKNKIRSRDE